MAVVVVVVVVEVIVVVDVALVVVSHTYIRTYVHAYIQPCILPACWQLVMTCQALQGRRRRGVQSKISRDMPSSIIRESYAES